MKKALVCSGGSVKGSWSSGAIKYLFEKGYTPDHFYGVSVGALNSTFMSNYIGSNYTTKEDIKWVDVADSLIKFWKDNIKNPDSIAIRKNYFRLAYDLIFKKFDGITDTAPLRKLISDNINIENIMKSPIGLTVGSVNITSSDIVYASPTFTNFIDYVIASCSIPITMGSSKIGNDKNLIYYDGGIRNIAPLSKAIEDGCDDIVVIACQSEKLEVESQNWGDIMVLVNRILDILLNQILNDDIKTCIKINENLDNYPGKKKINLTIIRPPKRLTIDIAKFTSKDIENMINLGYYTTKEILSVVKI